jgi:hypothetical protein
MLDGGGLTMSAPHADSAIVMTIDRINRCGLAIGVIPSGSDPLIHCDVCEHCTLAATKIAQNTAKSSVCSPSRTDV